MKKLPESIEHQHEAAMRSTALCLLLEHSSDQTKVDSKSLHVTIVVNQQTENLKLHRPKPESTL